MASLATVEGAGGGGDGAEPIVPRVPGKWIDKPGAPHTKKTGGDLMDDILSALGIPPAPMKAHALRSTFIPSPWRTAPTASW